MPATKPAVALQVPPSLSKDSQNDSDEFAVPAKTFIRFPKLATELQLQIWKYAIERPRIVELHTSTQDSDECFRSLTPNPAVLFVNRELRHEALKIYKPMFGIKNEDEDEANVLATRLIYVNPAIDTVYFEYDPYLTYQNSTDPNARQADMGAILTKYRQDSPEEFAQLKKVALPLVQYGSWNPANTVSKLVKQLDHTREITFVLKNELPGGLRKNNRYAYELGFGDDHEEDVSPDWTIDKFRLFLSVCFETRYRRVKGIPMGVYLTAEQKEQMKDEEPRVSIRDMAWIDARSGNREQD